MVPSGSQSKTSPRRSGVILSLHEAWAEGCHYHYCD